MCTVDEHLNQLESGDLPISLNPVWQRLHEDGCGQWVDQLQQQCVNALQPERHGQLDQWLKVLSQLPEAASPSWHVDAGRVTIRPHESVSTASLRELLLKLHPWRKGPFRLGGLTIDTEWRSDWKWDRIADCVDWRNRRVLDVGCGNGYFGWRMLDAGAHSVLGLDPFLLFVMQHNAIRKLADPNAPHDILPLTDVCLIPRLNAFDIAVSMGVLYHRTSPVDHLQMLRESLRPGGRLLLETLIIESNDQTVLTPKDRYAKMRNVWFIPSASMLTRWLERTRFFDIQIIDITRTTAEEQRSTDWMTFESLADFLHPADPQQTIEGYPAPVRAVVTAKKA